MILTSIQIERFRNFIDPQLMEVEGTVTALVGKNESGKTTILHALHRLNPANPGDDFDVTVEYPRRRLARDGRTEDLGQVEPVTAWFALEKNELDTIEAVLEFVPPQDLSVGASRNYNNELVVWLEVSFADVIRAAGTDIGVDNADLEALAGYGTPEDLATGARNLAKSLLDDGEQARSKAVAKIPVGIKKYAVLYSDSLTDPQTAALSEMLPKFFYFSSYELMPGECDLTALAQRVERGAPQRGDETIISLLRLAGQEPRSFLDETYISRQAQLQAAGSDLSEQVFRYWKQNTALKVMLDTDMPIVEIDANGVDVRHRILKVELLDLRHDVTTNFSTRSSGFQWFFSFLAAFSRYRDSNHRVVVLLDEPGTSLHGEAQKEFLSYIDNELGAAQQVIYTTHSQHMLDPARYEAMRAVHDQATMAQPELGVVITPVNLSADPSTILPVEAAIGYSVSQHLFLGSGPHLAVEGSSDFVYLVRLSEHLVSAGRTGLDPKLSILPVGGVGNMPAFVALMGRRLDVRALIDGAETAGTAKKVRSAGKAAGISPSKIVVLGEIDELPKTADIEDLFTTEDYLWLFNRATNNSVTEAELPDTSEPILRRLALLGHEFDHAGPAHQLTVDRVEFFARVNPETLNRFEKLFGLLQLS